MALTDAKIRAAKPTDKAYKLTDGAGMFLLVILMVPVTGVSVIVFWVRRKPWHLVCIRKFLSPKLVQNGMRPEN